MESEKFSARFALGFAAVAALVVLLASPSARQAIGLGHEADRIALEERVRSVLKDPYSARFRNEHVYPGRNGVPTTLCGEVNGKNELGAYVGFRRFVADAISEPVIDEMPFLMGGLWAARCMNEAP